MNTVPGGKGFLGAPFSLLNQPGLWRKRWIPNPRQEGGAVPSTWPGIAPLQEARGKRQGPHSEKFERASGTNCVGLDVAVEKGWPRALFQAPVLCFRFAKLVLPGTARVDHQSFRCNVEERS